MSSPAKAPAKWVKSGCLILPIAANYSTATSIEPDLDRATTGDGNVLDLLYLTPRAGGDSAIPNAFCNPLATHPLPCSTSPARMNLGLPCTPRTPSAVLEQFISLRRPTKNKLASLSAKGNNLNKVYCNDKMIHCEPCHLASLIHHLPMTFYPI